MTTINIDAYLSDYEKTKIAETVWREHCEKKLKKDFERLISNATLDQTRLLVAEQMGSNYDSIIADKVVERINGLTSYSVFAPKDFWEKESAGGFEALKKAVSDNRSLIEQRVKVIISEVEEYKLRDMIRDELSEIMLKIFTDKKEQLL